jgi:CopG family transcriptional regulator / antitoxin EndoAI
MPQQLQIILPEDTIQLIDRLAKKSNSAEDILHQRSDFINEAVKFYIAEKEKFRENLKQQLKKGAIQRAERDLGLVEEWFELEEEVWQRQ